MQTVLYTHYIIMNIRLFHSVASPWSMSTVMRQLVIHWNKHSCILIYYHFVLCGCVINIHALELSTWLAASPTDLEMGWNTDVLFWAHRYCLELNLNWPSKPSKFQGFAARTKFLDWKQEGRDWILVVNPWFGMFDKFDWLREHLCTLTACCLRA